MRWHGRRVTVYAHRAPTDMRKGFDSLCALVTEQLATSPLSGDVFVFVSRDRIRAKVLHFDGTGLCLYVKRLERGRFAALWREEGAAPITLTVSELDLFLDGSALVGRMALTPPPLTHFSLASDRPR
jgi:transposase